MTIKEKVHAACVLLIEERVRNSQEAMKLAQDGANSEDKSSAGDKHETGRAMAQLESEKAAKQMQESLDLLAVLKKINPGQASTNASLGSLVETSQGNFYLSVAAGKVELEGYQSFAISPGAPIGAKLMGLKIGESAEFNGKLFKITSLH